MPSKSNSTSVLENDVTVEGTISCGGKLIIKGVLKGKLKGEDVVVAREGKLLAETSVSHLTIDGTFEGDAKATQKLSVLKNGNCAGKVACKELVVEAGGVLNATVKHLETGN